jgi:phosphoglycolate phosphatase
MIAGVREMLLRLYERYPMAVVSARGEGGTLAFLEGHGLTSLFKVIVTGQTTEFTKPFPDPVLHAAREMNAPPEACLMVGDTIVDILAGKSAGAQTLGVLCGFGDEVELRQRGADEILPTTSELAAFLLDAK